MVLLTVTAALVDALQQLDAPAEDERQAVKVGAPIAHSRVVELSKLLQRHGVQPCRLDELLRGSHVYVPPPPPKPEPTAEYRELMARLRRDEERRAYERMINPPPPMETFAQRFPMAAAYPSIAEPAPFDTGDEEVTYSDVNRQLTVIFNVVISIVASAAALWTLARWWSTPARLALSMSGAIVVGVAEVVVYAGYLRRVGEAKSNEKKKKEVKTVINSWVVNGESKQERSTGVRTASETPGLRSRKPQTNT